MRGARRTESVRRSVARARQRRRWVFFSSLLEDRDRLVKRDAVILAVPVRLLPVPFKSHSAIRNRRRIVGG